MASRKVYLASPREPSGATWLINCLLELGIKTFRYSPDGMWRRARGRWSLSPHENLLRKWLPALSDHESFDFRDDIQVQWMHEWRSDRYAGSEIIYFVRDPRDALYSRYKREGSQLSFSEFAAFPDVNTLLDKVLNWKLFNEGWLSHPRVTVVRFEDYKADAGRTLRNVLNAMGLEFDTADVDRAVRNSTFDRAAAAERAYRADHPEDAQLINRSGRPMEWQAGTIDPSVVARIERLCSGLLFRLGYPSPAMQEVAIPLERHISCLRFFEQVTLDPAVLERAGNSSFMEDAFRQTVDFAMALNSDLITRANLPAYELAQLKASLAEYLASIESRIRDCFAQVTPSTVPPDPELIPLARLKRGLLRRVRRVIGSGT